MLEIKTRHNKELKALEGEKRAALKKAKSTAGKGPKAKELLTALETSYAEKLLTLQARHAEELAGSGGDISTTEESTLALTHEEQSAKDDHDQNVKAAKAEKTRRKREKQREKEKQREREIQEEMANSGPSQKDVEMEMLMEKLAPLNLKIEDVTADGHCLYRAVGRACGKEYREIRHLCADTIEQNEDEFAPFCEYQDNITTFQQYTDRVRNSADWGGHLELRALSIALKRPVIIYQALSSEPLHIESRHHDNDPIRLSYHRHYYALGEHYNLVVANC